MPTLCEVESNIGSIEVNAPRFSKKQWRDALYQMIQMATTELIAREERTTQNEKWSANH